ncbi:tetratricopeptide repeat protein 6, partial [Elysia marginata]
KRKPNQQQETKVEEKRGERTVDEIIASLRDQSAYQVETAADRKIKEIMSRVMSRTNAGLNLDDKGDGGGETDDDSMAASGGDNLLTVPASDLDLKLTPAATPDTTGSMKGDSPRAEGGSIVSADAFGGSMKDIAANQEQIVEESEGDGVSVTTKTTETVPTGGDQVDGEQDDESDLSDDIDLDYEDVGMDYVNFEQAWEDLMMPAQASNEDILNVQGEQKDLQGRGMPGPPYKDIKSNVLAPSVSFLATWGPPTSRTRKELAGEIKGKQDREFSKNIHHFSRMSTEFQLPAELMHVGRKYHTPDRFPSVMPEQPYRFQRGELSPLLESDSPSTSSSVRLEQAAQRVVQEAHKVQVEETGGSNTASLLEWQLRAENMLNENYTLAGEKASILTDESQVYWNPAPPKLGAASHLVRQILFPQYCVEELDEFGRVRVPVPGDEESDSSEEEEEETISLEDKAALERTVRRRHNSSETLTAFSREKTLVSMYSKMDEDQSDKVSSYHDDGVDTELGEDVPDSALDEEKSAAVVIPVASVDAVGAGADVDMKGIPPREEEDEEEMLARLGDSQSVIMRPRSKKGDMTFQRASSAPNLVATNDDTLIVPQDFNTAIHEITEQKRLLEKAKRQVRVQEAFEELEKMENLEKQQQQQEEQEIDADEQAQVQQDDHQALEDYNILTVNHPPKPTEEELTPAEKALLAGRNYVILPRKKKKKRGRNTMDMAKIEAVEKMLTQIPPNRLTRHGSMPKLNKIIEREMRVPWQVRSYRASIPDLLNFEEYKTRKRMPADDEEREWVRGIWNKWFDEVFPPTPDVSEDEDEVEETTTDAVEKKEEKKKKKDPISEILSQDVEEIDPIADTPENAQIYQILCEEIDKLSDVIGKMFNPSAFHFCRRGALYRKIGQLKRAENDLDKAISMEPGLLDAYWHRHLLYILQDRKSAALEDLNLIMKTNKNHSGAYRSMAEIYKRQDDITMAIINYSSAIKYNPLDHEAHYQRAQLYEQRGEMLLAMEDFTQAMKIMPSRTDAIMKHGMYYFENENWTHAINDFTELLRVDPLNSTAYLFRGRAYAKMSNWVPAVHDLSAAIHLDPYSWEAFYQRACILRKAHPMRALMDYSVSLLLNDSEENLMSYLHRGILYNSLGKPEDAIPDFESVLRLNKDIAAAHVNLGLIYMTKHSNYHRAIKKFSSAIKVDPTYVRAYVCRAEAYHKIHDGKNALKDFTRAIHLRPDMHHFYMHRGQLVLELGNLDLAGFCVRHASELGAGTFGSSPTQQAVVQSFLKNYERAVDALQQASREKPIAPYFMMLGKTHMKAKQFTEAVQSFKQALDKMYPWRKRDPWPSEAADAHHLCGLCHMELRNYSEALSEFNQAIKLRPNFADAYYQRGLASVKMRQMKGIQDFNRALALNPNIFQAYLSRACYYGMKGKFAKAILNCNEAIRLRPRSVRAYLYRGSLKYHIKAYELAIIDLSKAAAIDTQCALPFFNRAVCYHENKQYQKALSDYGIVLLLGNMLGLKVLINRGLLYFEQGDFMNALFDFQAAATFSPNDHRIHHTLGLCFHKLNRLQEAVATFSQCLRLKPFFLDGYIGRGNVFMDYGHKEGLELARRDYQRALRLDPQCLPARINLAYTAQVSGKLMQAWRHFTAVIEVRPNYKPALEGRAIVSLQMSSTFAAYQDISASINCGATAELLTNRGVINQFMGDRVMAMQDYQRAIKLDPTYALAYFNAGNVYFHTRHFRQALEYYQKATVHNPKDESAFLNLAITKVLLHDPQGALSAFKVAAKLSPYSAHIYFNRANLYTSLQQFDKAEREYSRALELKPDDSMMLKRRADVRGKLGRTAEAIEDYQRAVDIQTRPNKLLPPPPKSKTKSKNKG